MSAAATAELVIVDYQEIKATETSETLKKALVEAYGPDGNGILGIRNVPGFVDAKQAFLPMAHQLIQLPKDYLDKDLVDEASLYNAGWSHGKEKLGDKPDYNKGSFYFNPITDSPGTEEDRIKYPYSYPKNIWPSKHLPSFEKAGKKIGNILKDTTVELAKHIDTLATTHNPQYPKNLLYQAMKETEKAKARLLYYFPLDKEAATQNTQDSWIGWHNDSGFLTALAGDMYVRHSTGEIINCPDPEAGLYCIDRQNRVRKVAMPSDCLAVQLGECTQIMTEGSVTATPHCVRGVTNMPDVARISLPCFVDTPPTFLLQAHDPRSVLSVGESTKVPALKDRWTNGMTFGDFLKVTFERYYSFKSS